MVDMVVFAEPGAWPDRVDGEWTAEMVGTLPREGFRYEILDRTLLVRRDGGVWTVDMLETLPDDGRRYEIVDGTLLVSPAPVHRHQRALLRLAILLSDRCPTDHEVVIAPFDWQPEHRTSLQPDLLVARTALIGERNVRDRPTLVVEVASPGTARVDRTVKMRRYADGGIPHYWIIDPRVPSLEVYDLRDGVFVLVQSAVGSAKLSVQQPFPITLVPQALVNDLS